MHEMGVVHLDFKLENTVKIGDIMKIIDFGHAIRFGDWEQEKCLCKNDVGQKRTELLKFSLLMTVLKSLFYPKKIITTEKLLP
eukprot:UN14763